MSRYADEVWEIIRSGPVLYLFPLTIVLMLLTAGFTEEFFFRGFIQTRLEQCFDQGSRRWWSLPSSSGFTTCRMPI
jgi:membrane protease YdiL (CAAX protease family)